MMVLSGTVSHEGIVLFDNCLAVADLTELCRDDRLLVGLDSWSSLGGGVASIFFVLLRIGERMVSIDRSFAAANTGVVVICLVSCLQI